MFKNHAKGKNADLLKDQQSHDKLNVSIRNIPQSPPFDNLIDTYKNNFKNRLENRYKGSGWVKELNAKREELLKNTFDHEKYLNLRQEYEFEKRKQDKAATSIQKTYRGNRVRKRRRVDEVDLDDEAAWKS